MTNREFGLKDFARFMPCDTLVLKMRCKLPHAWGVFPPDMSLRSGGATALT